MWRFFSPERDGRRRKKGNDFEITWVRGHIASMLGKKKQAPLDMVGAGRGLGCYAVLVELLLGTKVEQRRVGRLEKKKVRGDFVE